MLSDSDAQALVQTYLEAFHRRDLPACVGFFADDARIHFAMGVYRGRQAIEEWHRDRFSADLRVLRVEAVRIEGDAVVVDAVATSKTARAWRFGEVAARATFTLEDGKIGEGKFSLRTGIPIEGW